jgi:hypothetical protein
MKAKIIILSIVLMLLSATASMGQVEVPAAYFDGAVKEMPEKKPGKLLATDGEALEFTWDKGSWKVPYSQIKTIYLSLSRQSELGLAFGFPGYAVGRLKKRKLLLSLIIADVFFLPEAAPLKFFETMEKQSGRNTVYESEEARRAVEEASEKTPGDNK